MNDAQKPDIKDGEKLNIIGLWLVNHVAVTKKTDEMTFIQKKVKTIDEKDLGDWEIIVRKYNPNRLYIPGK